MEIKKFPHTLRVDASILCARQHGSIWKTKRRERTNEKITFMMEHTFILCIAKYVPGVYIVYGKSSYECICAFVWVFIWSRLLQLLSFLFSVSLVIITIIILRFVAPSFHFCCFVSFFVCSKIQHSRLILLFSKIFTNFSYSQWV